MLQFRSNLRKDTYELAEHGRCPWALIGKRASATLCTQKTPPGGTALEWGTPGSQCAILHEPHTEPTGAEERTEFKTPETHERDRQPSLETLASPQFRVPHLGVWGRGGSRPWCPDHTTVHVVILTTFSSWKSQVCERTQKEVRTEPSIN